MFLINNGLKITLGILVAGSLGSCTTPLKDVERAEEQLTPKLSQETKTQAPSDESTSPELQEAIRLNEVGATFRRAGKYQQALESLQKALNIREKVLGKEHPDTAQSYNNIALVYDATGDYPQALSYHQKALNIVGEVLGKEHPNTAIIYNNIALVYDATGDYPQALSYHQKALNIWEKVLGKRHPNTATSYNNIALVYDATGDYSQALSYYQKALNIQEKVLGKEHSDTAQSYNNIAGVYDATGDYPQALSYSQKALNIWKKVLGKEHPDTATGYNNIAVVYKTTGDYPQALSYYQKALNIEEKVLGKEHPNTASSYNNIAAVYYATGDYPQALSYYQKALNIREKVLGKEHPATANSYNNITAVYHATGDYPQALSYSQKALNIREKVLGKEHPDTAQSYNNIAEVYRATGDYPQALSYFQKALNIREKVLGKEHPNTAIIYNNIALVYDAKGDYPQALSYHQKALNIREKVLGKEHPATANSYNNIAGAYHATGDYPQAHDLMLKAVDSYLQNRKNSFTGLSNQQKQHYLQSTDYYIHRLLEITTIYMLDLLKQGKQTEVEQIVEETANRWLAYKGSIVDSEIRLLTFARSSSNPKVKQAYLQLIELKKRYAKLSQATPSPKQKAEWRQQRQRLEQDIVSLQYDIAKQDPRFKQADDTQQITARKLSKWLKPNEVYMDFAWAGDTYYIFTITNDGWSSFNAMGSDSEIINTFVKSFDDNIQTARKQPQKLASLKTQSRQTLSKLYELLMTQEVKNNLANKTSLIISPDGALRQLPFEALFDTQAEQYLIEQKDIRYIASGQELVRVSQQRHQQAENQQAIVFANPNYGGNVAEVNDISEGVDTSAFESILSRSLPKSLFPAKPLAGTQREADSIKETLDNPSPKTYVANNASEANLLKVQSPKILHIATHGYFNADSIDPMLQSGLLLAGANTSKEQGKDEGIVSALKLSGLNLKGTDLVVLSACETGKVDPNNTEGISGLTKAFIQAGAKDVIMTLWQVDDNQSASLMESFYNKAKDNTLSYSEALKQSKLNMIDNDQHPYYWAGYVLSGL